MLKTMVATVTFPNGWETMYLVLNADNGDVLQKDNSGAPWFYKNKGDADYDAERMEVEAAEC